MLQLYLNQIHVLRDLLLKESSMKSLILAEKPSVARDIGEAMNIKGKRNGYIENEKYVVTWALGHFSH